MGNREMVECLVSEGLLKSGRIIRAFKETDRGIFCPGRMAYEDAAMPIKGGQTISAPHMVAIMMELLQPRKTDKVLEIGGGSGYSAAILGRLSRKVFSIEIDPELYKIARSNLKKSGVKNVSVILGDGSKGLPEAAPFDKVVFACAVPEIPRKTLNQLKDPGILMAPVGEGIQDLAIARKNKGKLAYESHGGVVFVPLRKPSSLS